MNFNPKLVRAATIAVNSGKYGSKHVATLRDTKLFLDVNKAHEANRSVALHQAIGKIPGLNTHNLSKLNADIEQIVDYLLEGKDLTDKELDFLLDRFMQYDKDRKGDVKKRTLVNRAVERVKQQSGKRPIRTIPEAADVLFEGKKVSLKRAQKVAKAIGAENIDIDQLRRGIEVEKEHGGRDKQTDVIPKKDSESYNTFGKIALAHLKEIPDYYTRLDKMEKQGKKAAKKTVKEAVDHLLERYLESDEYLFSLGRAYKQAMNNWYEKKHGSMIAAIKSKKKLSSHRPIRLMTTADRFVHEAVDQLLGEAVTSYLPAIEHVRQTARAISRRAVKLQRTIPARFTKKGQIIAPEHRIMIHPSYSAGRVKSKLGNVSLGLQKGHENRLLLGAEPMGSNDYKREMRVKGAMRLGRMSGEPYIWLHPHHAKQGGVGVEATLAHEYVHSKSPMARKINAWVSPSRSRKGDIGVDSRLRNKKMSLNSIQKHNSSEELLAYSTGSLLPSLAGFKDRGLSQAKIFGRVRKGKISSGQSAQRVLRHGGAVNTRPLNLFADFPSSPTPRMQHQYAKRKKKYLRNMYLTTQHVFGSQAPRGSERARALHQKINAKVRIKEAVDHLFHEGFLKDLVTYDLSQHHSRPGKRASHMRPVSSKKPPAYEPIGNYNPATVYPKGHPMSPTSTPVATAVVKQGKKFKRGMLIPIVAGLAAGVGYTAWDRYKNKK